MEMTPAERARQAAANGMSEDLKELRKRWARTTSRVIAQDDLAKIELLSMEQMMDRCVHLILRDEVVILPPPEVQGGGLQLHPMTTQAFRAYQAGNFMEHPTRTNAEGDPVMVETSQLWIKNPDRQQTDDVVYAIGEERWVGSIPGHQALNIWTPWDRQDTGADIDMFVRHLEYLIPDDEERKRFIQWLAHMEQKPHELPHSGYLMYTKSYGIGRNWLGDVLLRVWRGEVAPSINLSDLLTSNYNGRIGCKRLAIVDEVHMGNHRIMQPVVARLRQMMTEPMRVINPKYGKETVEYNKLRWLIFSNHDDALPVDTEDRRLHIIANPEKPMPASYYSKLYARLEDADFAEAIGYWLSTVDIGSFNPGAKPKMNAAKKAVVEASKSQLHRDTEDQLKQWASEGVEAFCFSDVVAQVDQEKRHKRELGHILQELGAFACGRHKLAGENQTLYAMPGRMDAVCVDGTKVLSPDKLAAQKELILAHRGKDGPLEPPAAARF
jgi:hypothetical protein